MHRLRTVVTQNVAHTLMLREHEGRLHLRDGTVSLHSARIVPLTACGIDPLSVPPPQIADFSDPLYPNWAN